ncbi:MAG: DNA-binding protein [Bacilli bacterium]
MDKEIYLTGLFDYYGELLTDKQKDYFKDYYFSNLSLAEIADNVNTSRNNIHKQLKDTENKLLHYEEKLGLYRRGLEIMEIVKDLDEDLKEQIEELI